MHQALTYLRPSNSLKVAPMRFMQALRFAFWPRLEEIALDHPRLAKSKVPLVRLPFAPH